MANLSNINNILRVSSSGVGINKNNTGPSELDIESAGADMIDMTRTNLKTYRFAISGTSDFSIFDVTADDDRLTIKSSGYVGIGTSSPDAKLEVYAGASTTQDNILWGGIIRNSANSAVNTGYGAGLKLKVSSDTTGEINKWAGIAGIAGSTFSNVTDLAFYANPTASNVPIELMRLTGEGKLGIGTDSPIGNLNINSGTGDTTTQDTTLSLTRTSSTSNVLAAKLVLTAPSTYQQNLVFRIKTTASSAENPSYYSDVMTLNYAGNVGIGTTLPTTALTIRKAIPAAASSYGLQASMVEFKSYYPGYDTETVKSAIYSGVSAQTTLQTTKGFMSFWTADEVAGGGESLTEKMRIESNGNVGIGEPVPLKPLHVKAPDAAGNIRLTRTGTSEYKDIGTYYTYTNGNSAGFGTTSAHKTFLTTNTYNALEINSSQEVSLLGFVGGDGFALPHDQNTGYSNFSAGGFGILFREAADNYILGNAYYYKTGGAAAWKAKYASGATLIASNVGEITFQTATSVAAGATLSFDPKMIIKNDGKVGIGTTSPTALLDVSQASGSTLIRLSNSDATLVNAGDIQARLLFAGRYYSGSGTQNVTSEIRQIKNNADGYGGGAEMAFLTNDTERFRIASSGATTQTMDSTTSLSHLWSQGVPLQNVWYTVYTYSQYDSVCFFAMVSFENDAGDGANQSAMFATGAGAAYGAAFAVEQISGGTGIEARRSSTSFQVRQTIGGYTSATRLNVRFVSIN